MRLNRCAFWHDKRKAGTCPWSRGAAPMTSIALVPEGLQRSRVVAGLLSLIAPGVGHLYIGRRRRGLILLALLLAVQPLLLVAAFFLPPAAIAIWGYGALLFAAMAGLHLFVLVDAVRLARRGESLRPRWYSYIAAIAAVWVSLAAISLAGAAVRPLLPWRTFSIPSSSMQPTLRLGEWVLGDARYF